MIIFTTNSLLTTAKDTNAIPIALQWNFVAWKMACSTGDWSVLHIVFYEAVTVATESIKLQYSN